MEARTETNIAYSCLVTSQYFLQMQQSLSILPKSKQTKFVSAPTPRKVCAMVEQARAAGAGVVVGGQASDVGELHYQLVITHSLWCFYPSNHLQ